MIVARVNDSFLYRSPDGREAWVLLNRDKGVAFIVTDIFGYGQPHNAVGFTADALRQIAADLDQRAPGQGHS